MATAEPASFRDPDGRVVVDDGRILRGLTDKAITDLTAAREAGLLGRLVEDGLLVDHWPVDREQLSTDLDLAWAGVIESRRLPVMTYPYEWSFEMLRAAALLTLDLSLTALDAGFQLKDASAYNVAFDGGKPTFIDLGSFEQGYSGLWVGYSQFVSHFLLPLLITSHLGVPFQPLLRTYLDGIPLDVGARLFQGRKGLSKGVAYHVRYGARVTRKSTRLSAERRQEISKRVTVPIEAAKANLRRMRRLVAGLSNPAGTEWEAYESTNSYSASEADEKRAFVAEAAGRFGGGVAWDIGANAGQYSLALLDHFEQVLAIEPDPGAADRLYRRAGEHANLHPVVMDIADPSPDRGWRLHERSALGRRAPADFAIWLAVVHHLCLGRGYPVDEVAALVAEVSPVAVVEYVDPADDMSVELLASRTSIPHGYSAEAYEHAFAERFEILEKRELKSTRTLYLVRAAHGG